jgi:hypothetical protein
MARLRHLAADHDDGSADDLRDALKGALYCCIRAPSGVARTTAPKNVGSQPGPLDHAGRMIEENSAMVAHDHAHIDRLWIGECRVRDLEVGPPITMSLRVGRSSRLGRPKRPQGRNVGQYLPQVDLDRCTAIG